MTFFSLLFENSLLLYALLAGIFASILGGMVGTLVVVRRITFVSGSIAHSILGGMGLFLFLSRTQGWTFLTPVGGALFAAILSALLISFIQRTHKEREDALIATIWTIGMALGILFLAKTPGYTVEISNFLIGNIMWVTFDHVITLAILSLLALLFIALFFQKLKLFIFDEEEAKLQGINTSRLYTSLLLLVSITVVALMQVVGIVLVLTMLTIPQMVASFFSKNLFKMMLFSTLFSILFTVGGLALAFHLDFPAGASIALLAAACYLVLLASSALLGFKRKG